MPSPFGFASIGNRVRIFDASIKDNRDLVRISADTSDDDNQRFEVMFGTDEEPNIGDVFILALKGGGEGRFVVRSVDATAKKNLSFGELERRELNRA